LRMRTKILKKAAITGTRFETLYHINETKADDKPNNRLVRSLYLAKRDKQKRPLVKRTRCCTRQESHLKWRKSM
jgi:hypothetical protein